MVLVQQPMDPPDVNGTPCALPEPTPDTDTPSCQGCRRRKLRCSREQPVCSHCKRLESPCVYDLKKNKPGIKAGAVGSLSRRVEALEQALLEKTQNGQQCCSTTTGESTARTSHDVVEVLSMLTSELRKLSSQPQPRSSSFARQVESLREPIVMSPAVSQSSSRHTAERQEGMPSQSASQPRKRRRVDSCGNPNVDLLLPLEQNLECSSASLPSADVMGHIIDRYFDVIQPWIPIIHETQFRRRVHDEEDLPQLVVILHAMVVAALRFVDSRLTSQEVESSMARSRSIVVLASMDSLSVENCQALIIIAFTDIGSGEASKAWSIIGSLTRTVEYLQLSVESDSTASGALLKPLPTISSPKDWTSEEQRRRVFWNIFCLDRFCSVTTGWNTSLTSDDVQRRLPADGGLWHKEEGVTTPFFGIWDRSVAKIGNSLAFLPGTYPSPEQTQDSTASSHRHNANVDMDMTTVGAFAYRIEATESLSRITTYFLQQKIDFQNRQQVSDWLTRFKELDLRLVHWKMFLPQRWRDSNISRQADLIDMDPNLTLAHVTHNTSMILLHQRIAYPDPWWSDSFKLPSICSAETCQVAAVETTTITQKYLKYTSTQSVVADQYAFCVFISARVLLIHWRHYKSEQLAPEFHILVDALDEMARRWVGPALSHKTDASLAGKYANQLRMLKEQCDSEPQFAIDVLGYSSGMSQGSPSSPFFPIPARPDAQGQVTQTNSAAYGDMTVNQMNVNGAANNVLPQLPPEVPMAHQMPQPGLTPGAEMHPDQLSAISHILMDEDFMTMDRIISLDDMIFAAPQGNQGLSWAPSGDGQV